MLVKSFDLSYFRVFRMKNLKQYGFYIKNTNIVQSSIPLR